MLFQVGNSSSACLRYISISNLWAKSLYKEAFFAARRQEIKCLRRGHEKYLSKQPELQTFPHLYIYVHGERRMCSRMRNRALAIFPRHTLYKVHAKRVSGVCAKKGWTLGLVLAIPLGDLSGGAAAKWNHQDWEKRLSCPADWICWCPKETLWILFTIKYIQVKAMPIAFFI